MRKTLSAALVSVFLAMTSGTVTLANAQTAGPSAAPSAPSAAEPDATDVALVEGSFDRVAQAMLAAMRTRADALKVTGVAVVSYFPGDKIEGWSSRMSVVGRLKDEPNGTQKGSNLLAIAYAKSAEMADTLKNSGSQARPPLTGEFGWEGGAIERLRGGYLLAAFSGGQSADDVAVSRAGLAEAVSQLRAGASKTPAQATAATHKAEATPKAVTTPKAGKTP